MPVDGGGMVRKRLPAASAVCLSGCCLHRGCNFAGRASQYSSTWEELGVLSGPLHIVQKSTAYVAEVVHFCCGFNRKVHE